MTITEHINGKKPCFSILSVIVNMFDIVKGSIDKEGKKKHLVYYIYINLYL